MFKVRWVTMGHRLMILPSRFWSVLLYDSHIWPPLTAAQLLILHVAASKAIRRVLQAQHRPDRLDIPDARFYYSTTSSCLSCSFLLHSPVQLKALVQDSQTDRQSWASMVREDLFWIWHYDHSLSSLPSPLGQGIMDWEMHIMSEPQQWKNMVKRVFRRFTHQGEKSDNSKKLSLDPDENHFEPTDTIPRLVRGFSAAYPPPPPPPTVPPPLAPPVGFVRRRLPGKQGPPAWLCPKAPEVVPAALTSRAAAGSKGWAGLGSVGARFGSRPPVDISKLVWGYCPTCGKECMSGQSFSRHLVSEHGWTMPERLYAHPHGIGFDCGACFDNRLSLLAHLTGQGKKLPTKCFRQIVLNNVLPLTVEEADEFAAQDCLRAEQKKKQSPYRW